MPLLTRAAFALPASSLAYHTGTWRVQMPVHQHRPAPCHTACPAGENAQAYLARVAESHPQAGWETLVAINPMPAVTGRVCHHPCEDGCNRRHYDEAIAIHCIERHLGDEAMRHDWAYPVVRPAADAPAVAVVGAGPAGLSAAYHLLRRGLNVTLFDELPEAGGVLRTAIPQYRLPRDVLAAETRRILALGIRFEPNRKLGRDFSLEELQRDFAAAFLAVGNAKAREWSIDGVTPRDLHAGLELLKDWVAMGSVPVPQSVAVVGGGNTAVDIARVLKRSGVKEVHVVTHQALPSLDVPPEVTMTAIAREIDQAREEGVIFHEFRGIRRLILRGEKVVGLELVHMKKVEREKGRFEAVAFEGTETVLHVEQIIPAIGQEVDPAGLETLLDGQPFLTVDHWGRVPHHPRLFAGGDARGGRGTLARAIGDGRRAAEAIEALVRDHKLQEAAEGATVAYDQLNLHYFEPRARVQPAMLPVPERRGNEEIEAGISGHEAFSESQRCFSCGDCLACDNCWTFCPDQAVLKTKEIASDGSHYVFDYDYCKGCGLCASECPCGYIAMREEA
jgi:NADPH-dependent glutamate synthase beta subunit-like oxidoreductase